MIWILCIFTLLFSSCEQKPRETHYKEIVSQAPQADAPSVPAARTMPADQTMPADPHAGLDMSAMAGLIAAQPVSQNLLAWGLPKGWKQEAGTHMRMATFRSMADPQAIDCSIIALGGSAGGLKANLERWMGQLGLPASADNLKQLLMSVQNMTTKGGLEAKVFDFTILQPQGAPSDKSMMAAMIGVDQTTVFVKMTGCVESVKQNKGNFLKLLGSITRK